jgi:hypothetical protein
MAAMPTDPEYDIFCSGHSFLADGRLLVTGGHISMPPPFDGGVGDDEASIYDPLANSWERLPTMNAGRWYPSNVTLADGNVLVVGGTYLRSTPPVTIVLNVVPQVFDSATNTWRELTGAQHGGLPAFADYYPFLYTAPNGKVFSAGPQQVARYLDTSGTGTWTDVATSSLVYRDYGSSVMYDHGKVLIVGGNPRDNSATVLPSASAEVIDLNNSAPAWRAVAPMHSGRRHLNTTLLPDGKVLVTGGSSAPGFDEPAGAALHAELWDPKSEQWILMAAQAHYRGYHSTAVLLPDGRVLVGGGGHPEPAIGAQYNFEIYSPPYLFNGPRPVISGAPRQAPYGRQFFVRTPDPAGITAVTWIRLPSVTHAFNQNQRINHLAFERTAGGLKIIAPGDSNIAPPGHYMLFILNDKGVPSVAQIIQLVDTQELIAWAYLPHASR